MKYISLYLSLYHLLCLTIRGTDFYLNYFFNFFVIDCAMYALMIYVFFAFKVYDNTILLVATLSNIILWIFNEIAIEINLENKTFEYYYILICIIPFIGVLENEINKRYFKK